MQENFDLSNFSDDQIIDMVGQLASLFNEAIPIENSIVITDREKFRHNYMGQWALEGGVQLIGKPFPKEGNVNVVLETGAKQGGIIPKEVYGVAFKSSTIPIKNPQGNVIGTLTLALSLANQTSLKEVTDSISASAQQLSASTEEIASSATLLSNNISDVLRETEEITRLIEQTNNILDFVNSVASNSKLLGLNAAIEAARAGELGKGFAVVANEIRKMAENSAVSVNDTKKIIASINDKVKLLMGKTEDLSEVAHSQAASTQEISASIQELSSSAQVVQKISDIV